MGSVEKHRMCRDALVCLQQVAREEVEDVIGFQRRTVQLKASKQAVADIVWLPFPFERKQKSSGASKQSNRTWPVKGNGTNKKWGFCIHAQNATPDTSTVGFEKQSPD